MREAAARASGEEDAPAPWMPGAFPNDRAFARLDQLLSTITPPAGPARPPLTLGQSTFPPPALLAETLHAARGGWSSYPAIAGTEPLRTAYADWLDRRFPAKPFPLDRLKNVQPIPGLRQALFALAEIACARKPGRPIVALANPFYPSAYGGALFAGAEILYLPARHEEALQQLRALEPQRMARLAAVYLCSPSNPEGHTASLETLRGYAELAVEADFGLFIDECYGEIYLGAPPAGGLEAASLAGAAPYANLVVLHSLSKRSSAPGLRSGFMAGDAAIVAAYRRMAEYGGVPMALPVQAAAAALWAEEEHPERHRDYIRAHADAAARHLGHLPGFFRPEAGLFIWLRIERALDFTRALWRDFGIRVLPGEFLAFEEPGGGNPGRDHVRIALVGDLDAFEAAMRDIADAAGRHSNQR